MNTAELLGFVEKMFFYDDMFESLEVHEDIASADEETLAYRMTKNIEERMGPEDKIFTLTHEGTRLEYDVWIGAWQALR